MSYPLPCSLVNSPNEERATPIPDRLHTARDLLSESQPKSMLSHSRATSALPDLAPNSARRAEAHKASGWRCRIKAALPFNDPLVGGWPSGNNWCWRLTYFLDCAGSTPTFRKYSCVERANGTDALRLARSYSAVPKSKALEQWEPIFGSRRSRKARTFLGPESFDSSIVCV